MAKIYAPNKEYNGISAGVPFTSGMAETEDQHLARWFRNRGYKVEESDTTSQEGNSEIEESNTTSQEGSRKKTRKVKKGQE